MFCRSLVISGVIVDWDAMYCKVYYLQLRESDLSMACNVDYKQEVQCKSSRAERTRVEPRLRSQCTEPSAQII